MWSSVFKVNCLLVHWRQMVNERGINEQPNVRLFFHLFCMFSGILSAIILVSSHPINQFNFLKDGFFIFFLTFGFHRSRFRTWWQQHGFAVVIGTIVTVVLILSAIGLWSVRQQAFQKYQPVGSSVPEQELQPLDS